MKSLRSLLVAGAVLLATFSSGMTTVALASTLYVDAGNVNCSDGGQGTQTQPYCTIGAAAGIATGGQTISVSSGTYRESVSPAHSGAAGAPITFAAAPGSTVTVTGGSNGFAISGRSYVTVQGFTVTGTTAPGIYLASSSNITITGNHVTYSGQPISGQTSSGIEVSGTSNSNISGNTVDHNTDAGIYVVNSSTGNTISSNVAFNNARGYVRAAPGIDVRAPGNIIVDNISHDNEDTGIQIYDGGDNNLVANNVMYNNGDHGIDVHNINGGRLIGNTVYHNCTDGINVEGTSNNFLVENNIAVDNAVYPAYNGISCSRRVGNIGIYDSAPSTTTANFNLVYLTTTGVLYDWAGVSYNSLSSLQAATRQELSGLQADPMWQSPATWDLHLREGSPAIDSADSGASGEQASDLASKPRVDDPTVANTGVGPRPYDDRGAYEFQPTDSPPAASLRVAPSSGNAPLAVTADASASTDTDSTPIASYTFDFGDHTVVGPQAAATAGHTYTASGSYQVTVTVKDTAGLASTATASVTVAADSPPLAALRVTPTGGAPPLAVTADASASSDGDATPIASYAFDFGDGNRSGPQPAATATHTYQLAGSYAVVVTVTDTAGLSSTASSRVVVDAPPAAALSVTPNSGRAPLAVTANAGGSTDSDSTPIASYAFDFGDGTVLAAQSASSAGHTYSAGGSFTVTVTVTDTAGHSATATATVVVDGPPAAVLAVSPASGAAPLAVTADASASTDGDSTPIASFSFDFGDGTVLGPQVAATANHTYTAVGSYTVTVTVSDTAGMSSTASRTVVVDAPPAAALSLTPTSGVAPVTVAADASASKDSDATPIASYAFNFGDGASTGPQPAATATHTYTTGGSFVVTVTVTDTAGFSSRATATVTVDGPPSVSLSVTPATGTSPLSVSADASASADGDGTPIASYRFDFGDGSVVGPQATAIASHTYTGAGTFTVIVTVTDTAGLAASSSSKVTVSATGTSGCSTNSFTRPPPTSSITYVGRIGSCKVGGGGATATILVGSAGVASGDSILIAMLMTATSAPAGAVGAVDSAGNSYHLDQSTLDSAGDRTVVLSSTRVRALATGASITVTFPASNQFMIVADEFSGLGYLDQRSAASGTGTSFNSGAAGPTTRAPELVYGVVAVVAGKGAPGWSPGWKPLSGINIGKNSLGTAYQVVNATGSYSASGKCSGTWTASATTY